MAKAQQVDTHNGEVAEVPIVPDGAEVAAPDGSTILPPGSTVADAPDVPVSTTENLPPVEASPLDAPDPGITESPAVGEPEEMTKEDRQKAINESYSHAVTTVRDKYLAEFNQARVNFLAERGIRWSPRPTKTDRDEQAIRKMLAEDPDLAARFTS